MLLPALLLVVVAPAAELPSCDSVASCNRIGTAAYQAGRYLEAVEIFERQIDYADTAIEVRRFADQPDEPKDIEGSALFQIYQAFASVDETDALRQRYAEGIAWGEAKQILFERIDREIAPMRARYQHLMDHPEEVEALLLAGAQKARAIATPFMTRLRQAVGLRTLTAGATTIQAKAGKTATASFKQYREKDGKFYFKLVGAGGEVLVQSLAFESPKVAGQTIAALQQGGPTALDAAIPMLQPLAPQQLEAVRVALRDLVEASTQA